MIHYGSIHNPRTKACKLLTYLEEAGLWGQMNAYKLAALVGSLAIHSVAAEVREQIRSRGLTIDNYPTVWMDDTGERQTISTYFLAELHPERC